jgi:hypothetical protein
VTDFYIYEVVHDLTGAPHTSLAQVGMVDLVRRAVGPQRTHRAVGRRECQTACGGRTVLRRRNQVPGLTHAARKRELQA